jgi:alpha/beta superfamily hydrolase
VIRLATTHDETPFFYEAGGEVLFGIVTTPTREPKGIGAVILSGGSFIGATNRNRLSVRIARYLAALGYHAVRIDYHGVGESTGDFDEYSLERLFVDDVLGAVRHLEEEHGLREFAFVGTTCFGSRTALSTAGQIGALHSLALFATPLRDFLDIQDPEVTSVSHYVRRLSAREIMRGLRSAERRRRYFWIARVKARGLVRRLLPRRRHAPTQSGDGMSPHFYGPLRELVERRVPVLLAYGVEDDFYRDFRAARSGARLSALLDAADSPITVRTAPDNIHGLIHIASQDAVVKLAQDWFGELDSAPAVP